MPSIVEDDKDTRWTKQSPQVLGIYVYVVMSCFISLYIQVNIIPFFCPQSILFFYPHTLYGSRVIRFVRYIRCFQHLVIMNNVFSFSESPKIITGGIAYLLLILTNCLHHFIPPSTTQESVSFLILTNTWVSVLGANSLSLSLPFIF